MSRLHLHGPKTLMLALAVWLAVACTPSLRALEPPVIGVSGLTLVDPQTVQLDLMITNLTPTRLEPERAEVSVEINDQAFIEWEQPVEWTVSPNARDVVSLSAQAPSPKIRRWLSELSQGERERLAWNVQMRFILPDENAIETTANGFLYPRPGQPDQFR